MASVNSGRLTTDPDVTGGLPIPTALLVIACAALLLAGEARGAAPAVTAGTVEHAGAAGDFTSVAMADNGDGDSPGLTNFKLSGKSEAAVLSDTDANGNAPIDAANFAALGEDEAYGRLPNGSGSFRTLSATPGAANPPLSLLAIEAADD